MMAHVWNEIEHDLGYKPMAWALSEQEKNLLVMLGQSIRVGDGTIASLFAETERRQAEQGGAFTDVYDFVARVRGWFPASDFGRHAGALYETLLPIRLVTPHGIRKLLDVPEPMTGAASAVLQEFSTKLAGRKETRFTLDANSSDLLLVLLLPKIGRHIAASQVDSGTDGVVRVRWFADRFREIYPPEGDG
jgi:hypothetical protein